MKIVDTNEKSQVQVIARAAAILRALENENAGLSLGQIAQRVDLARSTVQRIIAALEVEKLVIAASPNGKMRLGPTILRLAASVRTDFASLARPFLVDAQRVGQGFAAQRRRAQGVLLRAGLGAHPAAGDTGHQGEAG